MHRAAPENSSGVARVRAEEKGFEPDSTTLSPGTPADTTAESPERRPETIPPDPLQSRSIPAVETRVRSPAEHADLVVLVRAIAREIGIAAVLHALAGHGTEWE